MIEFGTRRVGILFFLLGLLILADSVALSASLRFPEVLLDPRSFAASLVKAGMVAVVVSLIGLLTSGVLFAVLSRSLVPLARDSVRRPVLVTGAAAGLCLAVSATLGLILVPLWANDVSAGVSVLAGFAFACAALAAPLLLAIWTVLLARQFRGIRVIGVLGALGLLLTFARSVVWAVNTLMPEDEGFYIMSAALRILTLLGHPLWACWLIRMGFAFRGPGQSSRPSRHLLLLAMGKRLGIALFIAVVLAAHATMMIISTPTPQTDDVPSIPSAAGELRYAVSLVLREQFALGSTYEALLAERQRDTYTRPQVPPDATLEDVDAGGVPAEYICARGASDDRVLLYLPGGGFVLPPGNSVRGFAANVSRGTGACVLMLRYRLAPEHPFPAAVQDGVSAYRWLLRQGRAASRIAIFGDSAGGNLALTTALSLRDSGDPLPAALVSISGVTDFTLSGQTWRTKADGEVIILGGTMDHTVRGYAAAGTSNMRDPLLSPLFADLDGLPPTLLMVGSQEVLLSDVIRMADKLRAAGVAVKLEVWPGMPHAWQSALKQTMETRLAVQHISSFISRRLS